MASMLNKVKDTLEDSVSSLFANSSNSTNSSKPSNDSIEDAVQPKKEQAWMKDYA